MASSNIDPVSGSGSASASASASDHAIDARKDRDPQQTARDEIDAQKNTADHPARPSCSINLDSLSLPTLSLTSPSTPLSACTEPPPATDPLHGPPRSAPRSALSSHPSRLPPGNLGGVKVPPGLAAKMAAMTRRKENHPAPLKPAHSLDPLSLFPSSSGPSTSSAAPLGPNLSRLTPPVGLSSSPNHNPMLNRKPKPNMKLADLNPTSCKAMSPNMRQKPKFVLPGGGGGGGGHSTPFANFSKIVDPSGRLNFGGKAVVHSNGVDFSNGSSFSINMEELTLMEELGKGNYGTVQKVFHKPTKVVMAMKEIRLELDDSKLKAILTELDILHRATSNTIVEFYGAFFIDTCVYYCMEFMDAGSLDKLAGADVPEPVLATVTSSVVEGLRFLKDELQTMHRDVKPTNILINRKGETKLCDFGVSGQLERSLAKTNIGCQSYMAPERIQGERAGEVTSYTVSSDVWSLGLSIVEFAIGHYPYPPETYSNIFAQLNEIVHGQSPRLPEHTYSASAQDFVGQCLRKDPKQRPSYNQLLNHWFLVSHAGVNVDMIQWVENALHHAKK